MADIKPIARPLPAEESTEPSVPPEKEPEGGRPVFRCEAAGVRAAKMVGAAFVELATVFQPQVAAQMAMELTKTVLTTPTGARILEE